MSVYVKQEWKDLPDQSTPLSADRLNYLEDGVANAVDFETLDELVATLLADPGSETYAAVQSMLEA